MRWTYRIISTVWLTCWTVVFPGSPWDMPTFVVYRVFYLYEFVPTAWIGPMTPVCGCPPWPCAPACTWRASAS